MQKLFSHISKSRWKQSSVPRPSGCLASANLLSFSKPGEWEALGATPWSDNKSNSNRWSKFDPLYEVIGGGVKIFSSPKHKLLQQFPYFASLLGGPTTLLPSHPKSSILERPTAPPSTAHSWPDGLRVRSLEPPPSPLPAAYTSGDVVVPESWNEK
jgi:hypothetical protein